MIATRLLLLLTILFSFSLQAKTLNIVAGVNKPPYVFVQNGKPAGFEIELVQEVVKLMGMEANFYLAPFARSIRLLENEHYDAVMTASARMPLINGIFSKPYISYQNVAISLKSNKLKINQISDLANYSMAGFQMASKVLGKPFNAASLSSPYYTELAEQHRQLIMLQQKRVEVLIMDVNIFNYFRNEQFPKTDINSVFPISKYSMAFKNGAYPVRFDRAMDQFRKTKAYLKLVEKYQMQHVL